MSKQPPNRNCRRGFVWPPAYPWPSTELLKDLRASLSANYASVLTFSRLASIIGQPTSTTHYWFEVFNHPQLRSFFCLLERLSPAQRQAFIEDHCRVLPHLGHPSINQVPDRHGQLVALRKRHAGITVLTGEEPARTFLFTALGHSASTSQTPDKVAGIDLRLPSDFVPVEGLMYADPASGSRPLKRLVQEAWPAIATSRASVVFLNGIWSVLPEMRPDIVRCSRFKHVILSEEEFSEAGAECMAPANSPVITVVSCRASGSRISYELRESL